MKYRIQEAPVRIPVPGGKRIDEHVCRASTGNSELSVAHMVAPPGWTEEPQTPAFDEVTVVVRGTLSVCIGDDETVALGAGSSIFLSRGVKVQYGNPGIHECEYWAICLPAFSPDLAGREH